MNFRNMSKSSRRRTVFMAAAILIAVAVVSLSFGFFGHSKADSQYFTELLQRGPIRTVVDATGTLQTLVTVQVGSQVSGQIDALYADYNSIVHRGQLLARIDPRNFEAQLEDSKANLAAATAHVQSLEAGLNMQKAGLEIAKANLAAALADSNNAAMILKRNLELNQSGLVAINDLDTVKANADSAAARVQQSQASIQEAQAQIVSAQAQLVQANAQVQQAKADVNSKQINLAYTNIYSPIDGVVISRSVDVGQTVAASLQAPVLFVIANDMTKMQVNASVDEADIGRISQNAAVRFTVDAYPNRRFSGIIGEIRLNPQSVQNVVTYSVIINVDNPGLELRPGLTANITFTVDSRPNALRIPNAALRYLPAGETQPQAAALIAQAFPAADRGSGPPPTARRQTPPPEAGKNPTANTGEKGEAPGQLWNPADKIQFSEPQHPATHPGLVWILDSSGKPAPKPVLLGITDGSYTEMVSGPLQESDRVIIADTSSAAPDSQPAVLPLGFGAGRRGGGRR
jgi:HlyD family secretion protein